MCSSGGRPHIRHLLATRLVHLRIHSYCCDQRHQAARVSSRGILLHTPQLLQMSLMPQELETSDHGMHIMQNQDDNDDLRFETRFTSRMSTGGSRNGFKASTLFIVRNSQKISLADPIKRIYALTPPILRKYIKDKTSNHQRLPAHANVDSVDLSVKQDTVSTFNVPKRSRALTIEVNGTEIVEEGHQADSDTIILYAWQAETDLEDFYARHST